MSAAPDSESAADATALGMMQRWFHAVITHPDGVTAGAGAAEGGEEMIDAHLTRSQALDAAGRLSVYADAYFARLIECMGEVFPMMRKFLGEETFDSFAFDYLKEMPSRSYTLHHLGRHFADWMEKSRPRAEAEAGVAPVSAGPDWPELLVDLARFEWAIYETFDGPGMEGQSPLNADDLLDLPPAEWDDVRLKPAPCLSVLTSRFPVNAFYTALRHAAEGEDVTPPEAQRAWIALNRRKYIVQRYDLTQPQHDLLHAVLNGKPLGEALDAAANVWPGSDTELGPALRQWFRDWAAWEFFTGVEKAEACTTVSVNAGSATAN